MEPITITKQLTRVQALAYLDVLRILDQRHITMVLQNVQMDDGPKSLVIRYHMHLGWMWNTYRGTK